MFGYENDDIRDDAENDVEWGIPDGPPPGLDLPFGRKRRREIGERIYDNRQTICVCAICYLAIAVGLLTAKIVMTPSRTDEVIVVDFDDTEDLERLRRELEEARELNEALTETSGDYSDVRNAMSNEGAERGEMSELTREIFDSSDRVMDDMAANAEDYERMLADISSTPAGGTKEPGRNARLSGGVTVSFSLVAPLRSAVSMPTPSYKCEGGGRVVVDIVVGRNGNVLSAGIDKSVSVGDECMCSAALSAAQRSRFNVDSSAPGRQSGTITYIFIPQ